MDERKIPVEVFSKSRPMNQVLEEYMKSWERAKAEAEATSPDKSEEEIFADTMRCAAYGIYLLGVEDGMKEGTK